MPRKEKPMPKRAKPALDNSPVYTTAEVCERHQISRRTLRRWGMERGFPDHWRSGRNEVYAKEEVHAWERIHTPKLWPKPVEPPKTDEDKHWDRLRAHYLLDKAEWEENLPSKPTRHSRRAARV